MAGPWEQFQSVDQGPWSNFASIETKPSKERTAGEAFKDIGASVVGGFGSLLQVPGQLAQLIPGLQGVGQALVKPGEFLEEKGESLKSQGLKVREALRSQAISEAEKEGMLSSFATAIIETIKDPALLSTFITGQLPQLLGPAAAAKVGKAVVLSRSGLEGAELAAQAGKIGTRSAIGAGAAMQGADISADAYKQALEAAQKQGMSEEDANAAALLAARKAFALAAPISVVSQALPGGSAIERRLAGVAGKGRVKSALGEAVSEAIEEGGGAFATNVGVLGVDPTRELTQGVGAAAGLGTIGGGILGGVLGKAPAPELPPEVRPGETDRQAAERIQAELLAMKEAAKPPAPGPILDTNNLYNLMAQPNGYALVEQYKQRLAELPETEETKAAIDEASFIQRRSVIEGLERQPTKAVLTDKTLKQMGFKPKDGVYESLLGKDMASPDQAEEITQTLSSAKAQEGITPAFVGRIDNAINVVNDLQQRVYPKEKEEVAEKAPAPSPAPSPVLDTNNLYNLMAQPNGYALVEQYKQRLTELPQTQETKSAIDEASFIQRRSVIESLGRQPTTAVLNDKALKNSGFKPKDGVYEALLGKDIANPDEADTVNQSLTTIKAKEGVSPSLVGKIDNFLVTLNEFQDSIYPRGKDAGQAITPPSGEGVQVAGEPGAGISAERPAAPVPGGVVPAVEDVGQPAGGEAAKPVAVAAPPVTPSPAVAETPAGAPATAQVAEVAGPPAEKTKPSKGPTLIQQTEAFGQAIGAVRPYRGALEGRKNLPAEKAVQTGDFQGVVNALEGSKNVTVAEVARKAKDLDTNIVLDDDAAEMYARQSPLMRQLSIDGAKMHLAALEKIRALAPQVDALPDGSSLWQLGENTPNAQTIEGIDNGEPTGSVSLARIADSGHSMFAPLPTGPIKLRTKEDFKALQRAFEDVTQEVGEEPLRLTSTGSAKVVGVAGVYDEKSNTIRVPSYAARREDVLAHEIVHAQTVKAIANPTKAQRPAVQRLENLHQHVKAKLEEKAKADENFRMPYGIESLQEFVAEGMSNPRFQFELNQIEYKSRTAWDSFVQTVADLLGIQKNTAFTELLGIYGQLTAPPPPKAVKTAAAKKHPATVMGSPLLALVSRRLNGLDPALMSEFSTRFITKQLDKSGRPIVRTRNPMVTGFGNLFREGGTGDYVEIATMLEEEGYLEPGAVERDYKEAGERAKDLIKAALNREEVQTLDEQREEQLRSEEESARLQQEDEEKRAAAEEAAVDKAFEEGAEQTDEEFVAGLRGMGFTEKEIAEELEGRKTKPAKKSLVEMRKRYEAGRAAEPAAPKPVEPTELDKEIQAKTEELGRVLSRILGKFGLKDVALNLVEGMKAEGEYAQSVIRLALDAVSPVQALRHESIHALKELGFFTPQQWSALEKQAKSKWIDQYLKNVNINKEPLGEGEKSRYDAYMDLYKGDMDAIIEEAIADAFGDFDVNKAPPGMMQAILTRLRNFFDAVKTAFGGEITAEQVFRKVEKGELKAEAAPATKAVTKASLRGEGFESFDEDYPTPESVAEGFKRGDLLVHARTKDDTDFRYGIEPSLGEFVKSTEGYQGMVEQYGDAPELTFFSDNTSDIDSWAKFFAKRDKPVQMVFVRKSDSMQKSLGNGKVMTSDGKTMSYEMSPLADYENELMRGEPAFVETGDWYTNKDQDVVAVMDYAPAAKPSLRAPQTEAFKKWSGGAPVVGLRQDHVFVSGKPVVVEALHGTTNADITEFKKSKANIESDFGAGFYASNTPADVAINYANVEGADLTRRIETLAERIADNEEFEGDMDAAMEEARKRLSQGAPNTMKLYMLFKNPAVLGGKGETFFDYNQSYNEETDEYGEPTGSLVDFVNQLDQIGDGIDISMRDVERAKQDLIEAGRDNEGLKFSELAQIVKDRFSDTYDLEDGSAANGEVLRQALEGMGFDGVIDTSAYSKFGPRMIRGAYSMIKTEGMAGLDKDTVHFVAFNPTQIKSATGNIGTFDAKKPDIRYSLRDSIGLYSELENKVAQGPNKAPAASWKAYINGLTQKGVKPEEIEWSGVRDWLDLQTGPVSKDAVNAYLKQGGVKVEEVVLGGRAPWRERLDLLENRGVRNLNADEREELNNLRERFDEEGPTPEPEEAQARYGQYTLPGGENYREVLLTLPSKIGTVDIEGWTAKVKRPVSPVTRKPEYEIFDASGKSVGTVYTEEQELDAIKTLARRIAQDKTEKQQFKSTHWDQPNVLAHIRLNDRTDADGNKVLFVEEIQSDWGQEGKKKGFGAGDWEAPFREWERGIRERAKTFYFDPTDTAEEQATALRMGKKLASREDLGSIATVMGERKQMEEAWAKSMALQKRVPAAPFVTKTEGWLNLALKRIMVMAAEGGYDKVAFVNGEQSADRYDLSKQVESIQWAKGPKGYSISAFQGGNEVTRKDGLSESDLEDVVGKEIAQKIVNGVGAEAMRNTPREMLFGAGNVGLLRGLDLKVGGEGMKAFYNQIVPLAVKKLLPKVGGGQMETVDFGEPSKAGRQLTPDERKELSELWRVAPAQRTEEQRERIAELNAIEDAPHSEGVGEQPGFSVTSEMKQKVETTGLPRFSLRSTIPTATRQRIVQTTVARDEKTFYQRIIEAISPNNFQSFRADALNRYDQLSVYDKKLAQKMGGKALLASSSAESAALFSDLGAGLTASALGVHDRMGGVPVYRNGVTVISNQNGTVKGPTAIFAPLAKQPGDYQAYQYWAGVKRGSRFLADGREQLFEPADIKKAEDLRKQYLKDGIDFNNIQKEWTKFNDGLVDYMVATGVLSKERADIYKKHSDYLPFYRQMDGVETVGPKIFQSISGIKPPKKLKGGEAPIDDFLENIVRNTQSAIQAGIKNIAAQRAADVAVKIQMADRLDYHSTAPNVFHVYENGKPVSYVTQDQLFINAVKSLGLPDLPFIGLFSGPANLLRNLVTKDPGFMLANLMRDSMSAWVTSGVKMKPMVDTISNFGSAIAGKSPEFQALMNSGILGGYEFSQNVEASGRQFGKALRKQANVKQPGMKGVLEMGAKPFTSLWEALEKGSTASDAATRIEIYKRTLAETGNEAEALYRALEVMNFNRKGSSAVVRVLTAAVPFLNARMQGLDVLYRAATGKMNVADAKQVQRNFFIRGATIAALSTLYWALTHDDDEYKKQEQETRDNYWLLPSLGVKIPIPFEIGVLFKVIPERILGYTMGSDTGEDFLKSMARQLTSTLAFNPIPQTVLPVVESMTNFSFFTMRPVVGQGLEGLQPAYQVGPSTSRIAEKIGAATKSLPTELQISPAKLDNLINGYTGTMGMYMVNLMDAIFDMNTDSPKPSKRFEQMPLIRRFAIDPEARGSVTAYYELKNSVDAIVRTSNMLERTMNYEELPGYLRDNARMLASKDYILDLEKTMKEFREMKILVRSAKMEADAKRDSIASIEKMENQLTANIQYLKRIAKGG